MSEYVSDYFFKVTVQLTRAPHIRTVTGTVSVWPDDYGSAPDAVSLHRAVMARVYDAVGSGFEYMPNDQVADEIVAGVLMYHVQPLELPTR